MDGAQAQQASQGQAQAQGQVQGRPGAQQLQNWIRPEQVSKLPHLTPQQKVQTESRVKQFWEFIHANQSNQSDPKYIQASQELHKLSANLMQGMKAYNQHRQRQREQQAAAAAAGAGAQAGQPNQNQTQQPQQNAAAQPQPASSAVTFSQLMPEVQARVNQHTFYFPPAMTEGTKPAEQWLQEAKARYGQAIQRAQMAKTKKNELQRAAHNRAQSGNPLTQAETDGLNAKIAQCDKAMRESQSFMEKFREQQEQFKNTRNQQRFSQPTASQPGADGSAGDGPSQNAQMPPNAQGPQAHSIASAQQAARNAASAGSTSVPGTSQPGSAAVNPGGGQPTPVDQPHVPFNSNAMMSQPQSRPTTAAGPPSAGPLGAGVQASHAHPASAVTAHPLNSINGMKTHPPPIPKNLQVSEPSPVNMPPARPTLNGGANVGLPGQLAQPALTSFPGYVLEQSEDGHLLSKKKLNELVREVLGPNSEDQLTAEAEEICLSLVDDFIDDLLVSSCRLAKLRGATSLEARDVQVVLERQYNIRVPGFSTDEVRTVRKNQPAQGWAHKVGAVQAAKLMNGTGSGNPVASGGGGATGGA